jgi:hypothetical protein
MVEAFMVESCTARIDQVFGGVAAGHRARP